MARNHNARFLTPKNLLSAFVDAFFMLTPQAQLKNPVMFVAYLGAILTTASVLLDLKNGLSSSFEIQISLWLWFTVLFANLAEAIAEARGKAQAKSLRRTQIEAFARREQNGVEVKVAAGDLLKDDIVICTAGEVIPADGEVIEGVATVDESAITGESAPVIRESGGDRSAVTAGTRVLSDRIKIRITSDPGQSFLDRMISLIEGSRRQRTPNEIALHILLTALTMIFVIATASLKTFGSYSAHEAHQDFSHILTLPVLISLLICLIPTTISALINAIGIAGIDRLIRRNVIALSGRAIEAAGDINLLILDKTGTITIGNRMATEFIPVSGVNEKELAEIAQIASLSDETPEGRSIVVLAKKEHNLRAEHLQTKHTKFIPFSAHTRMSGVDILNEKGEVVRRIRKGARDAIKIQIENDSGTYPQGLDEAVELIANQGGTPLLVSDDNRVVGIIHLRDVIKSGIKDKFDAMRKMGIKTVMITGDNPLTAAAIAAECGVDEYMAEATPEMKLEKIRLEQKGGRLVAMTGDGTNDAPALAQADVGVAMHTGTQASREAGNMVDLDSNPTKLIDIVEIGKQLLITRGALTTFSIANDVAKYFAIIPAIFGTLYATENTSDSPLGFMNIMDLHSPQSAILSAVIFNALIIVALIPLALRGVHYRALSSDDLLKRNLLIYGLGGLVAPFIAIKALDYCITLARLA